MTSRVGLKKVDYFVFGIGFGASLVLVGWALRQFGPGLRFRKTDSGRDVLSAEEMLIRHDWARFCISLGGLLSIAGAVVLLTTIVTLLIRPSDRAGSIVAGALFVLVLAGVAAWIGLFLSQHQGLGFRREAAAQMSTGQRPSRAFARQEEFDTEEELDEEPVAARQANPATSSQPVHQNRVRVRPTVRPVAPAVHDDTDSDAESANHPSDSESGAVDEALAAESTSTTSTTEHTPTQSFRGVRFTRPQRHETERPTDTESVAPASSANDEAHADTEGSASDSIADSGADNVKDNDASPEPTPQGAADVGGDDIVSSVTVRESPDDDTSVTPVESSEQITPLAEDKDEPVSSADAVMQRDVALANLRLRRINRTVHKDT